MDAYAGLSPRPYPLLDVSFKSPCMLCCLLPLRLGDCNLDGLVEHLCVGHCRLNLGLGHCCIDNLRNCGRGFVFSRRDSCFGGFCGLHPVPRSVSTLDLGSDLSCLRRGQVC